MQLSFIFENLKPRIVVDRLAIFGGPAGEDTQSEDLGDRPCRFIEHAKVSGQHHTVGLYPALNNAGDDLVSVLVGANRTNGGAAWLIAKWGDKELFRMGYFPSSAQPPAGVVPELRVISGATDVAVQRGQYGHFEFPGLIPKIFPNNTEIFGVVVQRARISAHSSAAERAARAWVIQLPEIKCSYQFTADDLVG